MSIIVPRALAVQGCGHAIEPSMVFAYDAAEYCYSKVMDIRRYCSWRFKIVDEPNGERGGVIGGLPGHACRYRA